MKFDPLFFMLLPMLKLTALASQSLICRKAAGRFSINIRFPERRDAGTSVGTSRLFSSVSLDNADSTVSEGQFGAEKEDFGHLERTKKAEKAFKGLTRMRLKKVLQTALTGAKENNHFQLFDRWYKFVSERNSRTSDILRYIETKNANNFNIKNFVVRTYFVFFFE